MEMDLVWLATRGVVTLVGAVLLIFASADLLDGESPGSGFAHNPKNLLSFEAIYSAATFIALTWFFSYGAHSFMWFLPEFTEDDEGMSRSGAAFTIGLVAAWLIVDIGGKLHRRH